MPRKTLLREIPAYYSTTQAAALLGVSRDTVSRQIKAESFQCEVTYHGRNPQILASDLNKLLGLTKDEEVRERLIAVGLMEDPSPTAASSPGPAPTDLPALTPEDARIAEIIREEKYKADPTRWIQPSTRTFAGLPQTEHVPIPVSREEIREYQERESRDQMRKWQRNNN